MLEGMLKEMGIDLKEAKGDNEAKLIQQIVKAFPNKYETMANKIRIANVGKVGTQEFANDIKSILGVDSKIVAPKIAPNPSRTYSSFIFTLPINGVDTEVQIVLAGGAGANAGNKFEFVIADDLQTFKDGGDEFTYKGIVEEIITTFKLTPTNFEVLPEGKKNQKRSLIFTPEGPLISTPKGQSIAETLTDITLVREGKPIYISLKFGDTLTLFNAGTKSVFSDKEITNGRITNPSGVALLEMLGIDNELFCRVFNEYEEDQEGTNFKEYQTKESPDQSKLNNFMASGIGSGYYMLKGSLKGNYEFFLIDEAYLKSAAKPTSGILVEYGGAGGSAKRVNAKFTTGEYKIEINIRNKQGGIAPSHIMANYKPL
tara:strand:- start:47 stop:1162 length:1116 start_codon:yes stop_codon:yes gene_type:complete